MNPAHSIQQPWNPAPTIHRLTAIRMRVIVRLRVEPVEFGTETLVFALAGVIFMLVMLLFTGESLVSRF